MIAAVTGATGAIGPILVEELAKSGFEVRALGRAQGDVTDLGAMRRAIAGADVVIHAAALLHINHPSPELHAQYQRVNVGGTENVVRAGLEARVKRIVYCSTIAVYGYNQQRLLTENDTPRPDTIYGETKLAGERAVLASGRGVVLRLAAVYGARVKGNYQRLLRSMARGRFLPLGDGSNRRTLVHERDVARAAVLAATHPRATGEVFNVTDGTLHTVREIVDAMAVAVGRKSPRLSLPVAPVRLGVGAVETLARLVRVRPPVTRALLEKYLEDVAVSGEKIRRQLGFQPAYDLQRGWSEAAEILRASGALR